MATTYTLGVDGKLYYGTAAEDNPTAMTELTLAQDVSVNLEADEAEITTRGGGGWKQHAQTLKDCTIEFDMLYQNDDAGYETIRDAYLDGTTVALAALDGAAATAGTEGLLGDFVITGFSLPQEVAGVMTVSVTARLNLFTEWYEASAS